MSGRVICVGAAKRMVRQGRMPLSQRNVPVFNEIETFNRFARIEPAMPGRLRHARNLKCSSISKVVSNHNP